MLKIIVGKVAGEPRNARERAVQRLCKLCNEHHVLSELFEELVRTTYAVADDLGVKIAICDAESEGVS